MALKAADIQKTFNQIRQKVEAVSWDGHVATLSSPVPQLMTELGPLTDKMGKQATVDAAVMLAGQMDSSMSQQLLDAIFKVQKTLAGAPVAATIGGVDAAASLTDCVANLRAAVTKQTAAVPAQTPSNSVFFIQLLDVVLIQSVAALPIVGPLAAGVLGGVATTMAAGFTYAGNYAATFFEVQDTKVLNPNDPVTGVGQNMQGFANTTLKNEAKNVASSISKGGAVFQKGNAGTIQGAVEGWGDGKGGSGKGADVSKAAQQATGLVSFVYYLKQARSQRAEKARLDALAKDSAKLDDAVKGLQFLTVQNPMTQNQAAYNVLARRRSGVDLPQVKAAGSALTECVKGESKTVSAYFDKIPDVFDKYKDLLLTVAYSSVVESFADLTAKFDQRLDSLKATNPGLGTRLNRFTGKERQSYVTALLILGYYFNRVYKNEPDIRRVWADEVAKYYTNVFDGGALRDPQLAKGGSTFAKVHASKGGAAIQDVFKEGQKSRQLNVVTTKLNWGQLETVACQYVGLVKNALVNELAQEFMRSTTNRKSLEDMLQLTIACSLIMNQVTAAATKPKEDIEIDNRYISMLAGLEFVNTYTKTIWVRDSTKEKLTGAKGSPADAKLRYPKPGALSTSASKSERSMVIMFASCVIAYVDIGKVVLGYQDWGATKEALHNIIFEINKAEAKI